MLDALSAILKKAPSLPSETNAKKSKKRRSPAMMFKSVTTTLDFLSRLFFSAQRNAAIKQNIDSKSRKATWIDRISTKATDPPSLH